MPFVIRESTPGDAEAIGKMAVEFQSQLRALGDKTKFVWGAAKYLRDGFGDNPAFKGLVAETESDVAAYLLYHFGYDTDVGRRLMFIIDLYVVEAFRHRGIATSLMERAAEIGRSRGAEAMFWSVFEKNTAALHFYEALGARRVTDLLFMTLAIGSGSARLKNAADKDKGQNRLGG